MELQNSFTVPAGIDQAWATLLDVERIAPCMPGATLDGVDGDNIDGKVKVKLGPVTMTYGGKATFVEKDADAHRAVIEGMGKETRGSGTAKALVHTQLTAEGPDVTRVDVTTDLTITGKAAQFGRGVMQDVAGRLVGQFADNLAALMAADAGGAPAEEEHPAPTGPAEEGVAAPPPPPRPAPAPLPHQGEAIDLMATAGAPVAKRAVPAILLVLVVGALIWWLMRRRSRD
ncbi:MAG: SRPBCC family protein [Candidatus Nanopelagicales bacterium]